MNFSFNFDDYYRNGEITAAFMSIMLIVLLIFAVFLIFYFIGMYKMYRKAGKAGWECLIPFYSTYVLTEIAGLNWWWFLIASASSLVVLIDNDGSLSSLMSLVSIFGHVVICYNMSKKFNKDTGWFVLSIFFGGITFPVLGYSDKTYYNPNAVVSKNGFFDDGSKNQNQQNNQQYNQQYNNYGQPMYNQPQNNYGQPMNNNYQQNNYGQPMNNNYPQNNYGQPMNNNNPQNNNQNNNFNNYNQ